MTDEPTPLQIAIREAVARSGKARDHFDRLLQVKLKTKGKPIYDIDRGKSKSPSVDLLKAIADVFGLPLSYFTQAAPEPDIPPVRDASTGDDTVEIGALDLSFSMGPGRTLDDYIEETPIRFDMGFIRSITRTPPHRLRLARGVGDSMFPTLLTSDRVMIDTTQRTLNLGDRVYAVSLYGAAAIKRLRTISPSKVLVISDNPNVADQEVAAEDIMIAGRVIWFARDL